MFSLKEARKCEFLFLLSHLNNINVLANTLKLIILIV